MDHQTRSVVVIPRQPIKEDSMQLVGSLLRINIPKESLKTASLESGIEVKVQSEKPFMVSAFWIVNIKQLHSDIEAYDWPSMRDALWDNKFLNTPDKTKYLSAPQIHLGQSYKEELSVHVKPPEGIDISKYNIVPRDFYPLVIIGISHERDDNKERSEAAATIFVLHIKDDIVTADSHVIKQYTKLVDGRILDVTLDLYVEEEDSCFICYETPENGPLYCLLPCRHSSICQDCIKRITECPKCRYPILSIFDMKAPLQRPKPSYEVDPNILHLYDDQNPNSQNRKNILQKSIGYIKSFWS